ncbi:MAG TPA: protein phosphatase 2C domain-containing protein [Caulobacteraceae bacterium]|jgi:serine/threonine protein phosphatase PrpC
MATLRFKTVSLTHTGLVRAANEDSFVAQEKDGVWAVADGMGGHVNGQWASSAVAAALRARPLAGDFDADVSILADAIQQANSLIFSTGVSQGARMGSTVVALHMRGDRFVCLWAGDSRIYLLRDGVLHRMSRDHTQVEDLVERGLLSREEAAHHPMSHVLSRAVGVEEVVDLDAVSDVAMPRDVFLLCSDGLTGLVTEDEIGGRLASLPADVACQHLLDLVLARGAPDNVTMVAVACEETTTLTLAPAAVF